MMAVKPWAVVTSAGSAAFLLSLALPWAEEWSGRRTTGLAVLFASDDYRPHLGVVLLALWGVAVVGAARGTRAWRLAALAATGAVGICPVYYAAALSRMRGTAFGQDEAGHFTEWAIQGRVAAGFYVAVIGCALLCLGVIMRCGPFGHGRVPAPIGISQPPEARRPS